MFGESVRAHRRRLGWTQEELADATGLSVRSIGKLEAGLITAPRPATVRLLADAFNLAADDRGRFCRAATGEALGQDDRVPAQLPADVPGFTGRQAELQRLDAALADAAGQSGGSRAEPARPRIAVISGTAGAGKSALAVHWAHRAADRFPDGQLYVNLRGFDPGGQVTDPSVAIRGFLDALGVPPPRIPPGLDAQAALYRSLVADKHMLVVADNARDEQQVRPLLPGTPATAVLVTSRSQLTGLVAVEGACPIALDQLSTIEARDLLARRLGDDRTDAEQEAVEHIIAACAGLPLALAIAASRAQQTSFPLATLAAELDAADQRLDALDTGEPASQVRAVISWSYATLSPPAARLFRLLTSHQQALAWFEAEHHVLAAALALAVKSGFDACAWRLPWTMATFLDGRAEWQQYADFQRLAITAATRLGDTAGQAVAHRLAASACARLGDYGQARAHLADCLALYRQLGDRAGEARVHQSLGWVAERQGRYTDALDHNEQALALYRAAGHRAGQADVLNSAGFCYALSGDYERAREYSRQALPLLRELGNRLHMAHAWDSVGYAEHHLGRLDEAADCYRQALGLYREVGNRYQEAVTITHLGDAYHADGRTQEAREAWQQALDILDDLHHPDAEEVRAKLASEVGQTNHGHA